MERHAVPQNIMELEFKLFGAFTIRQFGYLAGGFLLAAGVFFMGVIPIILRLIIAPIIAIGGIVLAVVKINGMPSATFLANYFQAMLTTQKRVWTKTAVTPEILKDHDDLTPNYSRHIMDQAKKDTGGINQSIPLAELSNKLKAKVDDTEDLRLNQIEKHFEFETSRVDSASSKQVNAKPHQPFAPVKAPLKQQTNVVNPGSQNIAGENTAGDNATVVAATPTYGVVVKPMTQEQRSAQSNAVVPAIPTAAAPVAKPSVTDSSQLQQQIEMLQQQLNQLKNTNVAAQAVSQTVEAPQPMSQAKPQSNLTNTTQPETIESSQMVQPVNRLAGIILDKAGQPLDAATIYVSDIKGNIVRKVLSNIEGKFMLQNPLEQGEYYLDIESAGHKFARYKIAIDGRVIPVIKFTAK